MPAEDAAAAVPLCSTTIQIYGCGFNVIFAGNKIRAMHVTEKCIGSSGIAIFGIHYQGGPSNPNSASFRS